jgi:hypothetical protein
MFSLNDNRNAWNTPMIASVQQLGMRLTFLLPVLLYRKKNAAVWQKNTLSVFNSLQQ